MKTNYKDKNTDNGKFLYPVREETVITRPSRKARKELYRVLRHASVDKNCGSLIYDSRYPWTEEHRSTLAMENDWMKVNYDRSEPITHKYSTDWLEYIGSFLSDESPIFLPRVWSSQLIESYTQEYSFVEARDYVRSNPDYSIQYGWLLNRDAMWIFADFHAAVKSPTGEISLVQQTLGAPFERAVAFVPDNKNKPDYVNNSSPALVGLNLFDSNTFAVGDRIRRLGRSGISYEPIHFREFDADSTIVKEGKCPHQPSETMDLIGDIPRSEIIRQLKEAA